MDLLPTSFLPGDPRLINQIVYELKSQGIFDQFRKECIADVDTKPAYQNLSQRVEGSVMNFLNKQKFAENINKNQLREQLRKNITESGFLESGVERIVDQVVNPKINSVFLPKVEDVVYRFLGIQRPSQEAPQSETKPPIEDLLPHDLEAISPESVHDQSFNSTQGQSKDDSKAEGNDTLNSSDAKTEDESPSFEPLEESTKFSVQEENSVDSHLSGMSGLSHNSKKIHDVDMAIQVEAAQDVSLHSEANLSIITSEEDTKMEICENKAMAVANEHNAEKVSEKNEIVNVQHCGDSTSAPSETALDKPECKSDKVVNEENSVEVKKLDISKGDSKRSHDKHKSSRSDSHKREHKDKRDRSKSESKSKDHKEKTSSKHSSTSKDKDKDCANRKEESIETEKTKKEDKDRHKSKSSSSSKSKDKDRSEKRDKSKEKSEKEEKTHKDKDRTNKEKSDVDKASKSAKFKSSKDKEKSDKSRLEKDQSDKDKSSKSSKDKSAGLFKTENKDKIRSSSKEKGQPSSSIHSSQDKTSTKGSKDKSKSGSSTSSKDKDKKVDGSKSRSTEKHKKSEKTQSASHEKYGSSSRKGKEKRTSDDHYSFKDKKGTRRSTDRDSNDGSSNMSRNGSVTEGGSSSYKGSSKESSEAFSSGGGESSNSENVENKPAGDGIISLPNAEAPPIKYLKPKFASNIHEAMKLMKIRKQLAKLERQNQLALTTVSIDDGEKIEPEIQQDTKSDTTLDPPDVKLPELPSKRSSSPLKNILELQIQLEKQADEAQRAAVDNIPELKSQDISLESFAALEARLALEMSNVNDRTYGYGEDEDDDIEYSALTTSPVKQRKLSEKQEIYHSLFEESAPNSREAQTDQKPLEANAAEENLDSDCVTSQPSKTRTFILDQNSDEEIELAAGGQSKSRIRDQNSILRTVLLNPEPPVSSNEAEFIGFANTSREEGILLKLTQLAEQINNKIAEIELKAKSFKASNKSAGQTTNLGCSPCASIKHMNGKKLVINIEKVEFSLKSTVLPLNTTHVVSKVVKPLNGGFEVTNFKQNGQNSGNNQQASSKLSENTVAEVKGVMEWENEDIPCYFFEKPVTADITVLNRQIQRLENNIEKQLRKIEHSASAVKKQGRKRQLVAAERNIEAKLAAKRSRLNDAILEQNTCNTNVSSHHDFILPLSPAESEKSGEQKKEEPAPVKLRKSTRGSTSQRYSTDDLYKPRPALGCSGSRRKGSRGDTVGPSQP